MPLAFPPLDCLSHAQLHCLVARRCDNPAAEHDEHLLRGGFVPADHPVELGDRYVQIATSDTRVPEPLGAEVLDLPRR